MQVEKLQGISLINGDCTEYMKTLPDNCFDLAIVDPPYGLGIDGQKECICKNPKHNRKAHEHRGWDNKIPPPEYFKELKRISVNQIIWGANYFVENLVGSKGWIVWFKGQEGLTMSDCELAYSSFNTPARLVNINRAELIKQNTFHPTEKPIKLYKWILSKYAKQGDKILDTHLGSGSICIACHDLGFEMTGVELDPEYYEAAKKRLQNHQLQQSLF